MSRTHLKLQIAKCKFSIFNFQFSILNTLLVGAVAVLALCLAVVRSPAAEPSAPPREHAPREIFVPFADLHVLLEQQPKRVLLSREEYDELLKKAKKTPETHAPRPAVIVAADYSITTGQQRAEIKGTLAIDVLEDGLHALPLDIGGVGLQSATLDNRAAAIGRGEGGRLVLFVEGIGRHELALQMVAPVETTAARQVLNFRLPRPAAARLRLTAPGDVELKGGADVVSRTVDEQAKLTRFELLPREGDTSLLMTLNSHLQRQQQAVIARSVLVDEVTQGYEKLHATVSLEVLYRAVDQFRFAVPDGFEITDVTSPLLARWDVQTEGGRKVLTAKLREQTTDAVVLRVSAIHTPGRLEGWHAPRLEPLDVVGGVTVFGLLVEDRLKAQSLAAEGLIPIDTSVLGDVLPATLLEGGPGAPALRPVAAWYAPQNAFTLSAQYVKPPAEMAATTSLLLVLADKGQEVLGGLSLLPLVEKRFSFDVSVPAGWQVAGVTAANGQPLPFERYSATEKASQVSSLLPGEGQGVRALLPLAEKPDGGPGNSPHPNPLPAGEGTTRDAAGRIRVAVAAGIAVGEEFKMNFRALRTPPGWLAEWPSSNVEFPAFAVIGATRQEGAIAVDVRDDMTVRPDKLVQLTPLDAAEKPKYGLAGVATTLAYRYESPKYAASLVVERTRPRLTARTFSFFRVEPDALACHYELIYAIEEARTQRLALLLPESTPPSVAIAALDGIRLKEFTSEAVGHQRRWNVLLAEAQRGRVRLAVDFQQPLPSQEPKGFALPVVVADGVAYQSGLLAVEGCAELDVTVKAEETGTGTSPHADSSGRQHGGSEPVPVSSPARPVDVGELAEADYQPGRRLLGAFGFVGDPPELKIDVLRHPGYPIYPAIVEECSLDTNLAPEGQSQTQARFKLRTKAVYVQVKLPPKAKLWSAELDGAAIKPQKQGDGILIDLPASTAAKAQVLQIVYAAPVDGVALRGTVEVPAPKLLLRAEQKKEAVEVPLAELVWRLHLPNGYEVVRTGGTVVTSELQRPVPAAVQVAGMLYYLTGGLPGPWLTMPSGCSAVPRAAKSVERVPMVEDSMRATTTAPSYTPVDLAKHSEAETRIRAALKSPAQFEFVNTPLRGVVDYLKDRYHIEVQLDNKALADVGIAPDTPITQSVKDVSLRSALRLMLKEHGLTYVIAEEVLLITTPEDADNKLETKVYPVADLVVPPGATDAEEADFDSLIDLLKQNVRPTSWDDSGGVGSISPFGTNLSLVISQNQEVQDEISDVIDRLRKLNKEQAKLGVPTRKPLSEEERRARQAALAGQGGGTPGGLGGGAGGGRKGMMGGMGGMGGSFGGRGKDMRGGMGGKPEGKNPEPTELDTTTLTRPPATPAPAASAPAPRPPAEKSVEKKPRLPKLAETPSEAAKPSARETSEATSSDKATRTYPDAAVLDKPLGEQRFEAGARPRDAGRSVALAGVRSLKIDVVQGPSDTITFQSLGVEPKLVVTLANRSRFDALAWGLALAVGLMGLAMTCRPAGTKTAFVFTVALLATLAPLLTESIEVAQVCNTVFYAAALLVPCYLAVGLVRWLVGTCCRVGARRSVVAPAVPATPAAILLAIVLVSGAYAGEPNEKSQPAANGPYVIQVVEPPAPVNVPEDAIILPYDPESTNILKHADKLLVPYDKYVELWNRAHPDKKIETKAAPAPYALAGASYKTLLEGDDYLLLSGLMEIDVFADGFVQVPLKLSGGVLAQAELDGKPARLNVAAVADKPSAQEAKPQAANVPTAERSVAVLYVSGKGRHKLQLAVRLKLSKQGGWRVADGALPAAPATALQITVPKPQTEVRLGQLSDRRGYETEKPDEAINTALGIDGALSIQWRPKVAEGQVDRSLTAVSNAVLDVQEDGLRLAWQLALEFRRSQREQFQLSLPADFLLEKVEGNNVRGWEIRKTDRGQTVEISLLQAAKDREQFTLRLWRAGTVGKADLAQFDVPLVSVTDAALHNGQLTIRRSPLLELQTLNRSGATRTDLPADAAKLAGGDESPLGIRPFEAYSFAAVPFTVRLAAAPVAARASAAVETILKLAAYERSLESRVKFDVQGRPVYQLQMFLPEDLRLDHVSAPGEFQYAVTQQDKRPLLTIYLAAGRQGDVAVLVRGKLGREGELKELPLPRLEVLGVDRQQGDVAVQVDPAFDVDAVGLKNCEPLLLGRLYGWLNPRQRQVTRLGLHYKQGDYAGTLRLSPRKADVACDTISNVRVTDRAIEETILLDFAIKNAGVRELSFLLPAWMAGSRISVPMLRQKSVEPVSKEAGAPLRVRIELQDEVMDQLRILVENDRLLTPGPHEAPIPTVELGRTNRRYVALESAGRDEVVVARDNLREVDPLVRQQKEWGLLKGILGREMTLAYLVEPDARQPRLSFHTETHAAVTTVGARIGLAETTLVLDANGAYRAQVVLHVDNTTEQFLEVRLPEGAKLWTARVAGEPVKPTTMPGAADPNRVRIPLIKTAPGDLSYEVVLKYGGRMPALSPLGNVAFPVVHCENIRPELSQVRLHLPEQYRWFDFGGTMRLVGEDADLQAGYVKFLTKQTEQLLTTLQHGDKFAKVRALNNLKQIGVGVVNTPSSITAKVGANTELQSELAANASVAQQAQREATEQEKAPEQAQMRSNRDQLSTAFQRQNLKGARNVVNESGANWSYVEGQKTSGAAAEGRPFSREWLDKNGLVVSGKLESDAKGAEKQLVKDGERLSRAYRGAPQVFDDKSKTAAEMPNQPSANQVAQPGVIVQEEEEGERKLQRQAGTPMGGQQARGEPAGSVDRYRQRLQEQSQQGGQNPAQPPTPLGLAADYSSSRQAGASPGSAFRRSGSTTTTNMSREERQRMADGGGMGGVKFGLTNNKGVMNPVQIEKLEGLDTVVLRGSPQDVEQARRMIQQVEQLGEKGKDLPATGLASLDFQLPARGTLYCLTTPQGEVEITAREVSNDILRRLAEIAVVAVVALVVWFAVRSARCGRFAWLAERTGSMLLICLGVLSFCGGILPVLGLAALVAGCGALIHHKVCGTRKVAVQQ